MSITQPIASHSTLLTREQAAEFLGLAPTTLAVWASTGRHNLPFIKVGRAVRYKLTDLERWLTARTATSTGELDIARV